MFSRKTQVLLLNYILSVCTWSYCKCGEHVQHCFLYDLKPKRPFIRRANGKWVKAINKFYFHSLVTHSVVDKVQDLDKTELTSFNLKVYSYSKKEE